MNAEDYRLAALGDADAQVRVADYYDEYLRGEHDVTCSRTRKICIVGLKLQQSMAILMLWNFLVTFAVKTQRKGLNGL